MGYIFDLCIENLKFGDSFGLMTKFVGILMILYNDNYRGNAALSCTLPETS